MDTELSEKLKKEQNIYLKVSSKIRQNEERLKLVYAGKPSTDYFSVHDNFCKFMKVGVFYLKD